MNLCICFFASERYWKDSDELYAAIELMKTDMSYLGGNIKVALNEEDLYEIEGDVMVALPMSGGVQAMAVKAAERFGAVCVFPGYIKGNFNAEVTEKMLSLNAAPAVMDIYSVLKRRQDNVFMCLNKNILDMTLKSCSAYFRIISSKLLLIGDTEPWVISASRDLSVYRKLGITFEQIPLETMISYYRKVSAEDVKNVYNTWYHGAFEIIEPTNDDVISASRFCAALERLIKDYNAGGAAIACFNLLNRLHTTACLAVSYINNSTEYIAACEGDTDSAVTMLMIKSLSKNGVWMANPNLQADNTVNFVHCTAPINICGKNCAYSLRNHHESGIGVSPEVKFPHGLTLTACRLSGNSGKLTVQKCVGQNDVREESCRTQYRVKFDDFGKYIDTALGCHQAFAFEDISEEMKLLAKMLRVDIL